MRLHLWAKTWLSFSRRHLVANGEWRSLLDLHRQSPFLSNLITNLLHLFSGILWPSCSSTQWHLYCQIDRTPSLKLSHVIPNTTFAHFNTKDKTRSHMFHRIRNLRHPVEMSTPHQIERGYSDHWGIRRTYRQAWCSDWLLERDSMLLASYKNSLLGGRHNCQATAS